MKDPIKVEIGRKGGLTRAANMTAEERKAVAIRAAATRIETHSLYPKATHKGTVDIGDISIPCAVLNDGMRVLSETGISEFNGGKRSGGAIKRKAEDIKFGRAPTPVFISAKCLEPFILEVFGAEPPVLITYKIGKQVLTGYDASILPKVCEVWLKAREAGVLQTQQLPKAQRAEVMMRGLAHIGIIALVDEATGYQDARDRDELHKLLGLYLSNEKLTWAKRFPDEFYKQLYRLKNWSYPSAVNHCSYVGKLTNSLVYEKLPEGVLEELRERNPKKEGSGQRKWRHHQFLSEDIGQADLRDHLLQLVAIMRASENWDDFIINFNRVFK